MTIYEIKNRTLQSSPYFFTPKTLRFFGQTMKSFRIQKQKDGRYLIYAPICINGRNIGETIRYFNPITNELERN